MAFDVEKALEWINQSIKVRHRPTAKSENQVQCLKYLKIHSVYLEFSITVNSRLYQKFNMIILWIRLILCNLYAVSISTCTCGILK